MRPGNPDVPSRSELQSARFEDRIAVLFIHDFTVGFPASRSFSLVSWFQAAGTDLSSVGCAELARGSSNFRLRHVRCGWLGLLPGLIDFLMRKVLDPREAISRRTGANQLVDLSRHIPQMTPEVTRNHCAFPAF
jgi:hypothetical protein